MKIPNINAFSLTFKGQRQDRKTIEQLKKDNSYDLNLPNQRRIHKAIDNLSKISGESNVEFLLDVAENLKYGTNIDLGKASYNDWRVQLNKATKSSLAKSDLQTQTKLKNRVDKAFANNDTLSDIEKEILSQRELLLKQVDKNALKDIKNKNIKELERNLDYFIISSEVPTSQKLYIVKRLNHFMSPEYKINPQLADKKTQALAEIVNDIVVNTPESKIPNIKAVNQQASGICAAISISRKLMAYEEKAKYVDMIMSELDDSPNLKVYDVNNLGNGAKIDVPKSNLDFTYALERGYRIIDTSSMYWMTVANLKGSANEGNSTYYGFDKANFDTFHDSHLYPDISPELEKDHDYYRALLKAESAIKSVKKQKARNADKLHNQAHLEKENLDLSAKYMQLLRNKIVEIAPNADDKQARNIANEILKLEVADSEDAKKVDASKRNYVYVANEPQSIKIKKISEFLADNIAGVKVSNTLKTQVNEVLELASSLNSIERTTTSPSYAAKNVRKLKSLYKAAAAYRTQADFQLEIPKALDGVMNDLGISDRESLIVENMTMLVEQLKTGTMKPELKQKLAQNFGTANDPDKLLEILEGNRDTISYVLTDIFDDLYACSLAINRKNALATQLSAQKTLVDMDDKATITDMAQKLGVKESKNIVSEELSRYMDYLSLPECGEDDYITIYNQLGYKSQLRSFKDAFDELNKALFDSKNQDILQGFNVINGLPADASREQSIDVFNRIAYQFNTLSQMISYHQEALQVVDDNGNILNTVKPKDIAMKKMENMGELISANDLKLLQNKITKIDKAYADSDAIKTTMKSLPSELTTLTSYEKEVLKKIESNINSWYSMTTRKMDSQYKEIKDPLNEHHRALGMNEGYRWMSAEGHSGLAAFSQVRLLEHMTGRPYYIEYDNKYALERIKDKSVYSGISSTHTSTNEMGAHAQYIADVKSIPVKEGDKTVIKNAFFHDNSWGPAEYENVWVDENGLLRTDYARGMGGEGYITGENYQNGSFIDETVKGVGKQTRPNVQNKMFNKLNKNNYYGKYQLMTDVVMPGQYPNPMQYVSMFRQYTLNSPSRNLPDLKEHASKMTRSQLKKAMENAKQAGLTSLDLYESYLKEINGVEGSKKAMTVEDYKNLPANNRLKLALEKLAVIKSYNDIPDVKIFYKESTSIKDIEEMKAKIRQEAHKNFYYIFGKDIDIAKYIYDELGQEIYDLLLEYNNKNKLDLKQEKIDKIFRKILDVKSSDFDGSVAHTIELITNNAKEVLTDKTEPTENKDEQIEVLANKIREILKTNMGFTLADLNSSSFEIGRLESVVNWIDEVFDPKTDEEFVQIFNKLRNMTTKEFKAKYEKLIDDKAMGIKPVEGYQMFELIKAENEKTQDSFFNVLYQQEYLKEGEVSKTKPSYDYEKFSRKLNGSIYEGKRSFDDLYADYHYSLLQLVWDKRFKPYKQMNFENYKAFPVFPKVDYEINSVQDLADNMYAELMDKIRYVDAIKNQVKTLEILHNLVARVDKLDINQPLSKYQQEKIRKDLEQFIFLNEEDETISVHVNNAKIALQKDTTAQEFQTLIHGIFKELKHYEYTTAGTPLKTLIPEIIEEIVQKQKQIITQTIEPKYQGKAFEVLNRWVSAKSKAFANRDMKKEEECDMIFAEFVEILEKHRIMKSPDQVLDTYLLLNAKDAKPSDILLKDSEIKDFENLKNIYGENVESLLNCANLADIQSTLMSCAKSGNLNIVAEALKNSKLLMENGMTYPLSSDTALFYMLRPLVTGGVDLNTAQMFLESLGLAERYIEMSNNLTLFDNIKKNIDEIHRVRMCVAQQAQIVNEELEKMKNLDECENYKQKLETLRLKIKRRCKKEANYAKTLSIFDAAIKEVLTQIEKNPNGSKVAILFSNMNFALQGIEQISMKQIEVLNEALNGVEDSYNLIKILNLPKNSEAEAKRQEFIAKIDEVIDYREQCDIKYNNIE